MIEIGVIETIALLLAAIYFMLQSSISMIHRGSLLFYLPVFVLGMIFCFQASALYFGDVSVTTIVQDSLAIATYVFYLYVFGSMIEHE